MILTELSLWSEALDCIIMQANSPQAAFQYHCACWDKATPCRTKCCTCHACKLEDLELQNATLRKSTPWPPKGLTEMSLAPHATCIFWRSFSNVPCLPQNPHASLALPRCRIHCASHARPHPNFKECSETTSFNVCDLRMCFVPQGCGCFQHLNLKAQRAWGVSRLFAFKNDFRATALCAFSTCQCPFTF